MRLAPAARDDKTMLRVYSGEQKGATVFHSTSIGAEPYSFAIWRRTHGSDRQFALEISATDINENVVQTMEAEERPYFEQAWKTR
jgi:chemotaxis methyl-accepting protein methylase